MRHRPVRLPGPPTRRRHRDLRGTGDPAHVAWLRVELLVPHSRSLKDKRQVLRPILDGVRHRFAVAAAEVAHQDTWQRAGIGISAVGSSPGHVTEVLDKVERFVWSFPEVEVVAAQREWVEVDG